MKNTIIKLLVCFLALNLTPEIAQAQFGNLGKRLKNKVERRIENKVDKTVDKVLNGKPNKRNSRNDSQVQTSPTKNENKGTSRSRETGGYTNSENEEDQRLRYKYSQIIRDCESFLDYQSGHAFRVMNRDNEYTVLRKKMTPTFMDSYFSKDERSSKHISELEDCKEHVATDGFEDASFEVIDAVYMRFDKKEAHSRLKELSEDFAFINRVVIPNNSKLQKVTAYAEKLRDKLGQKIDVAMDKIACSPFHKQNMGKIFFTSNPNINPVTATASSFKNSFKAGEDIYGVVYFDKKISTIMGGSGRINYGGLTIKNGRGTGSNEMDYNGNYDPTKSYSVFVIYADASRYKNKTGSTFPTVSLNAEYLSKLPPRNHTIIANVGYDNAKGSFQFDANDDSKLAGMATTAKKLRNRITANKKIPKAGMRNASYEKQLVNLFNSMGWSEKFKKAVITSKDYGYKRVAGRITGRTLTVLMFSKKSDGTCMYQDFTVIQPKAGSSYGSFRRLSTGGQSDIGCDKF
jgi:hypothetical protein